MSEENKNLEQNEYNQNQTEFTEPKGEEMQPASFETTEDTLQSTSQVNENPNAVQNVAQGYSVTAQPQMGSSYNFWQQQSGGYENTYQQTQQAYTNMAMTPPPKKKRDYKIVKNVAKAAAVGVCSSRWLLWSSVWSQ